MKESTDEPQQSPTRRGSQVYRGSTGGLLLEDDQTSESLFGDIKSDPWVLLKCSLCSLLYSYNAIVTIGAKPFVILLILFR